MKIEESKISKIVLAVCKEEGVPNKAIGWIDTIKGTVGFDAPGVGAKAIKKTPAYLAKKIEERILSAFPKAKITYVHPYDIMLVR